GMGTQYFYTAEAVRRMADAYRQVTPDTLAAAIEKVRPEFDGRFFVPAYLAEKFAVVRRELAVVADKGWAMIAGMI
ncbi:MAG: hypothetical protein JF615_08070, partial [Asticcacaulis sp.]|nr:hypothetical protein [Asticcacaulis sp.]